jgi:ABC-type oligopeptide transport system substrate-binding subunit/ABC-type branched-subunit amino acid transport system substrate-binding protein
MAYLLFLIHQNNTFIKLAFVFASSIIFLFACDGIKSSNTREKYFSQSPDDILVAVVDSSNLQSDFVEGVRLAFDQINKLGVLGKKIKPVYFDDQGSCKKGQIIAKKISRNQKIMAVIGHNCSDVAISASITYEKNGILFISPGATDPDLIQNHEKYIFRNIPSNEQLTKRLVEYAITNNLNKIAVVSENKSEMSQLSNYFIAQFTQLGGEVVNNRTFISWETNFKGIINEINQGEPFDAIFLSGNYSSSAEFIKQARKMGLNHTILATNNLDTISLFHIAKEHALNVVIPTFFDPQQPLSETRDFVNNFTKKNGTVPEFLAASGFDAVLLIAEAIEKAGSFVPVEIATTLRLMNNWRGATGCFSMNMNGGISNKMIFLKQTTTDGFQYIEKQLVNEVNINEVIKDFTLRIPIEGSIPTIDPGMGNNTSSIEIIEQLFAGLTTFDPETFKPVPEIAESWTSSADCQHYTFFLRKDAFWTYGKPITAHDIQWAIIRNLKPETHSPYAFTLYILKNARLFHQGKSNDPLSVGVQVINDYIITFHLNKPAPYFPSMTGVCAFRPLPRHIIEKNPDSWTQPDKIVSNGPYKLAAWEKGLMLILRKNSDYYHKNKVSIPEVRYIVVSNGKLGMEMYKSGELDIMGGNYLPIPTGRLFDIASNPFYKGQYFQKNTHCSYAFAFNTQHKPVDNIWVRKAINAAIERSRMIQFILNGQHCIAHNFTPQLSCFFDNKNDEGFDPVKAKQWLAKAGYPDGKNFPNIKIAYNQSDFHEQIAKGIQSCLKYYLNIYSTLMPLTWDQYEQSLSSSKEWHLIRFSWCADYPDPNNWLNELFHPEKSSNIIGWNNSEFIKLMDQADYTQNYSDRIQIYRKAERILCKKFCGIVPIFFNRSHYLVHPRIKGWYHMPLGGQHISNWILK